MDFNHELAGKDLIFDVDVTEIIDNDEDKIKSMIELHYAAPNMDINKTVIDIDGDVVNITLDDVAKFDQKSYMDVTFARFRIAKDIWENMDFEKVNFVDSFEKKQEEDEEEAENRFYETLYAAMCKDNDEFDFTICEQEAREIQK